MDIKANINYVLEGKFKVDIFNKEGVLIESTDWFNNFITPTGLSYIYRYKFADCFRYLSLGTSAEQNSGDKGGATGTTGLHGKIDFLRTNLDSGIRPTITGENGVWYKGDPYTGTLNAQYMGSWAYEPSANSIMESPSGPKFYRTWRVPFYDSILTGYGATNGLEIKEFMVSPSSGEDLLGNNAFSRVVRNVTIPDQTYAFISYQLGIGLGSTSIQILSGKTFDTGSADIINEKNEVEQWSNLSGYYRQTYHGLAWIDANGTTFTPKYGAIMEPSWTGMDSCRFYLSPDNGQFDVHPTGGAQTNEAEAYSTDGLLKFIYESPFQDVISDSNKDSSTPASPKLPTNIRLNGKAPHIYDYTSQGDNTLSSLKDYDYQKFSNATPGATTYGTGLYSDSAQFGNKVLISTKGFNIPATSLTGRVRTLTRRHSFMPSQSLGKNTRFGSMVYAYNDSTNYWPMIDCMFIDNSGQSLMAHYRQITGIYFDNRGSGILDAFAFTVPALDKPFTHRTFQGPGTGDLNSHPALLGN